MFAYVIIHFGDNIKYLEYEIYSILMLKSISNHDIIYMYSSIDTPEIFVKTIKNMGIKTKSFNDSILFKKSQAFTSFYKQFNLLRICCFIYANTLIQYDKICIVESDILLSKGFNNVFDLKVPSVYFHNDNINVATKNSKIILDKTEMLKVCNNSKKSPINGGVMLFKPDKNILKNFEKYIDIMLENKCIFPNEILFLLIYDKIYNLPINYNIRKYMDFPNVEIYGRHFDCTTYKALDIIKDDYIDKIKTPIVKKSVKHFKKKYYDKYNKEISMIINSVKTKL